MTTMTRNYILDEDIVRKKLKRMALEIIENNSDEKEIIIAGIRENGSVVAKNVQKMLEEFSSIPISMLTISLDKKHPDEVILSDSVNFNNKVIIIIDDVANTGKTLLYALKPLLEYHPKKIQTMVLVERTHKMFPVHPDYVGLSIATTLQEHIYVEVEGQRVKGVYLE